MQRNLRHICGGHDALPSPIRHFLWGACPPVPRGIYATGPPVEKMVPARLNCATLQLRCRVRCRNPGGGEAETGISYFAAETREASRRKTRRMAGVGNQLERGAFASSLE